MNDNEYNNNDDPSIELFSGNLTGWIIGAILLVAVIVAVPMLVNMFF